MSALVENEPASKRPRLLDRKPLLCDAYPDIFSRIHHEQDINVDLNSLTTGSNFTLQWICAAHHLYHRIVQEEVKSVRGCSQCHLEANLLSVKSTDLFQEIHSTKNVGINTGMLTNRSNQVVWWRCASGHDFQKSPAERTAKKGWGGCPSCKPKSKYEDARLSDRGQVRDDIARGDKHEIFVATLLATHPDIAQVTRIAQWGGWSDLVVEFGNDVGKRHVQIKTLASTVVNGVAVIHQYQGNCPSANYPSDLLLMFVDSDAQKFALAYARDIPNGQTSISCNFKT